MSAEEIEQGENENKPVNGSSNGTNGSGNVDFNPEKKEPASTKQKNFIKSMMENMNLEVDYDALDRMTKFEAHDRIEQLKKQMDGVKA